jgi:hypothetical protein
MKSLAPLLPLPLLVGLTLVAPSARADATKQDAVARADEAFQKAKSLRAEGKYPEACAAFAESKRLAPGVGVSLYLGDCYAHLGQNARAAAAFHEAQKLAVARKDKRADVAYARSLEIEPHLGHIGIANLMGASAVVEVQVDDGDVTPLSSWTALGVDPGDHTMHFRVGGNEVRQVPAHVEVGRWTMVKLDPPPGIAAAQAAPAVVDPVISSDARKVAEYSLVVAGAIGVATGAALLSVKNQSLSTGAPDGSPSVDQRAAIGADMAFGIGGAALVSAVLLYLTAPVRHDTGLVLAPSPVANGAGAFLSGRF